MTFCGTTTLRARFAARLSALYGQEVPAYTTLVEVSHEVNQRVLARDGDRAERSAASTGSPPNGTAPSGSAVPARWPRSPGSSGRWGCSRPASTTCATPHPQPVPVVSTAFRPIDRDELAKNPFRVFTSMLVPEDRRFFDADLEGRLKTLRRRAAALPRRAADPRRPRRGRRRPARRGRRPLPRARGRLVRALTGAGRPGLVRRARAGLRRRRRHRWCDQHPHQPPDPTGARHRRPLPAHAGSRHHHDRRASRARRGGTGRTCCCGRPRSAPWHEPRLFREPGRHPQRGCAAGPLR